MAAGTVIALLLVMVALAALPSASVMLVVVRSAAFGVSNGIATAVGIVVGDLLFVSMALLGMAALAQQLGGLFFVVRLLAAAYLVWLGISLLRGTRRSHAGAWPRESSATASLATSCLAGLLLTLGDIKAIFFYASLFPAFLDLEALTTADTVMVFAVTMLAVGGVKIAYALLAGQQRNILPGNSACGRRLRRVGGGLMIGAGAYLACKS